MSIGIDASRANEKQKTGTEWYSFYLIEEIKKIAPPDMEFILYSKDKLNYGLEKLPNNFKSKVLNWPLKFLWTQLRLSWEMIWHQPDVLFVPAHTIPIVHPQKTVTILHDIGFEKYPELYSQRLIGYKKSFLKKIIWLLVKILTLGKYSNTELDYHRFSAKFALKHAKKIMTVSQFTKHEIINTYPVNPEKIAVVYPGYNNQYKQLDRQDKKAPEVLNKYHIKKPFFLSVGRLEEKKNTAGIVRAFSLFKSQSQKNDYQLVLAGKPGYNFDKVQENIKKYHLEKDIIMTGFVSDADLPYLMKQAHLFLMPSFYEGFGLPIIEAMACGIPVITSNFASMKEVAGTSQYLRNREKIFRPLNPPFPTLLFLLSCKLLIPNQLSLKSYDQNQSSNISLIDFWRKVICLVAFGDKAGLKISEIYNKIVG